MSDSSWGLLHSCCPFTTAMIWARFVAWTRKTSIPTHSCNTSRLSISGDVVANTLDILRTSRRKSCLKIMLSSFVYQISWKFSFLVLGNTHKLETCEKLTAGREYERLTLESISMIWNDLLVFFSSLSLLEFYDKRSLSFIFTCCSWSWDISLQGLRGSNSRSSSYKNAISKLMKQ